ncbi:terminase small subunit [Vagococcus fluvialis]|uniref:terminase small subunit n=1 Tax=Vagococcus fluvialis TaxID=2738 RepID=UPI00288F6224|nr:terminase small subunit [Vagococcus fluvialis]MDT2781400.1 terminase small subunit [Vagococcus fluvialis]
MNEEIKDKALELYQKGWKYKDIASELDISVNTFKSWIRRYGWTKNKGAPKNEKVHPEKEVPAAILELNENSDLNEKQKFFCLYYLQSFNATQSYLKAYKCSYETAMVNGNQLLRKTNIKEELTRLKQELQSEQFFTLQDIINNYAKQAFSDMSDFVDFGSDEYYVYERDSKGNKKRVINEFTGKEETYKLSSVNLKNSDEVDGTLIQEVKKGKDGVSVKLYDKQKAMQELTKLLTTHDIDKATAEAKLRELEAKVKIIENTADKLVLDKEKQSQVLDLIALGQKLIGGDEDVTT